MRVASLLPSATEILFALGAGEDLVAVSEKCDYPAEAAARKVVVRARLDDSRPQADIDAQVNRLLAAGESLYEVDTAALMQLQCDLVVTQDVCHVCAASPADLAAAMERGQCPARVLSLHPMGLEDVWLDIERIGAAVGREHQARLLADALRARTQAPAAAPAIRPRVLCLEWFDPPFVAGHWVPEMVARAGGDDVLGVAGEPGYRCEWEKILRSDPDLIVLMPCGYHLDQVEEQARRFSWPPGWSELRAVRSGQVYVVDASGQFSRHGPRLADGVQTLREVIANISEPAVGAASQANWRRFRGSIA